MLCPQQYLTKFAVYTVRFNLDRYNRRALSSPAILCCTAGLALVSLIVPPACAQETEAPATSEEHKVTGPPLARFVAPGAVSEELAPLFKEILDTLRFSTPRDVDDDERQLRRLRAAAVESLATEGFFAARVTAQPDTEGKARYVLQVDPGARAQVAAVELAFKGAIETDEARLAELRASWELVPGSPFRDGVWTTAKNRLLSRVSERDYAAAQLIDSVAEVDLEAARVTLRVEIDSGPSFTFGETKIDGLERYEPQLVRRYTQIDPGARYDSTQLLEAQRRLQTSGFFSSVAVEIDLAQAERTPVQVKLKEAQTKRFSIGTGYSTNTGPRLELTYRQTLLFGYPYTLQTGAGIDHTRRVAYTDILLPPKPNGALDSLGVLSERTDIEGLITNRNATGVARAYTRESKGATYDTRLSLNFQREKKRSPDFAPLTNDVVSTTYTWTRRRVDQITDPRRGNILTLSGTAGLRRAPADELINQSFVRGYGRYVLYVPLSARDQVILRGEGGHVVADEASFVPNEFLFRAGGAGSVRGYRYQSLGVKSGGTTLGSRSLVVGSAEYVRWLSENWGAAAFYDVGDADDKLLDVRWAKGYGLGARWRTLAGPLALDFAYGERDKRWRVHFAIAIAF